MTDDQHRIGKLTSAQLVVVDALERWEAKAPDERPEPIAVGAWVIQQLQASGWSPPRDPAADQPPLAGPGAPSDGPGRQAFNAARAELAARRRNPS